MHDIIIIDCFLLHPKLSKSFVVKYSPPKNIETNRKKQKRYCRVVILKESLALARRVATNSKLTEGYDRRTAKNGI